MHVYESIRDYINEQKLDPSIIAEQAGIDEQRFSDIMTGESMLYADDFREICIAINATPEEFIRESGNYKYNKRYHR